jgi:hypothetical protein
MDDWLRPFFDEVRMGGRERERERERERKGEE